MFSALSLRFCPVRTCQSRVHCASMLPFQSCKRESMKSTHGHDAGRGLMTSCAPKYSLFQLAAHLTCPATLHLKAGAGLSCLYNSSVRGWGHRQRRTGRPLVPVTSFGKNRFKFPPLHWDRGENWKTPAEQASQGGDGEDITGPMPQAHRLESEKLVPS